jgi:hypothetical protein
MKLKFSIIGPTSQMRNALNGARHIQCVEFRLVSNKASLDLFDSDVAAHCSRRTGYGAANLSYGLT